MVIRNSSKGYGLVSKMFHWTTFILLIAQVPFGFYLVGLEFSDQRIDLENIHILIGISIFNHYLLYISIFSITISGVLKKLYMGEKLNFFIFKYAFKESNFQLADNFYVVHIYANYLLISLVSLHILAVIVHHILFKDKIIKKML